MADDDKRISRGPLSDQVLIMRNIRVGRQVTRVRIYANVVDDIIKVTLLSIRKELLKEEEKAIRATASIRKHER